MYLLVGVCVYAFSLLLTQVQIDAGPSQQLQLRETLDYGQEQVQLQWLGTQLSRVQLVLSGWRLLLMQQL